MLTIIYGMALKAIMIMKSPNCL